MAKKTRKPKPTRMHPIGESLDGESYLMEVCSEGEESSKPQVAICTRSKPGQPGPLGSQMGTMKTLEDGHVEFHPLDTSTTKIQVEDHSEAEDDGGRGKGPAKYNNRAFRDGWARTFGKN